MDNQKNENWSFSFDFTGVNAATGKSRQAAEGYYQGIIVDAYINADRPERVIFRATFGSDFPGQTALTGLRMPRDKDDKVIYYWRGLLESCGYTGEQLDRGATGIGAQVFLQKPTSFYYCPGDPDAIEENKKYSKVQFLGHGEWARQKQEFDAKSNLASPANQSPTLNAPPTSTPQGVPSNGVSQAATGFAAPNTSTNELLNMLK